MDSVPPQEAVAPIRSGMRVFVHGAAATPTPLLDALAARTDLDGVTLYHLHLEGRVTVAEPELAGRFRCNSLFTGAALRGAVNEGRALQHRGDAPVSYITALMTVPAASVVAITEPRPSALWHHSRGHRLARTPLVTLEMQFAF